MAKDIGFQVRQVSEEDYASVPQSVIGDATELAISILGDNKKNVDDFAAQLISSYVEARDKDVVVIFNSGGWGWNSTKDTPGWSTILEGIKKQLEDLGYSSAILTYQRTPSNIMGCAREFIEALRRYPNKARDLAIRVEFLTDHLPDLKVIVAGESTGTVISDKTMAFLKDKTQVYSIQTGTPFWYKPSDQTRTLLMNNNGKTVDTFSYGNIPAMVWATVKGWFGASSEGDNPGNILLWLKAPGHDYSWQYPGVYSAVIKFLDQNFGTKEP
jgi:hypothetical protein